MAEISARKTEKSIKKVSKNILAIYARKEIAAFAIAASFAIKALNQFRRDQSGNKFWTNRTQQALQRVFSGPFKDSEGLGFFLAHGIEYGVFLELANNRKHAALVPITKGLVGSFISNLKVLYGKG